jgi:hypothetical protein
MHIEIQVALNFVISYLYNKLPRRRVNIFGEEVEKALKHKFQGHWYPDKPFKVSIDFFVCDFFCFCHSHSDASLLFLLPKRYENGSICFISCLLTHFIFFPPVGCIFCICHTIIIFIFCAELALEKCVQKKKGCEGQKYQEQAETLVA